MKLKNLILSIVFFCSIFPSILVSAGTLKISLKEEASSKFTETKNIEVPNLYYLYKKEYISNKEGNLLISSYKIYQIDSDFTITERFVNAAGSLISLSDDEKYLVLSIQDRAKQATIHFFNIASGTIDRTFHMKRTACEESVLWSYLFDKSEKMVFQSGGCGSNFIYTKWIDKAFTEPVLIETSLGYDMVFSAPLGKKFVYRGMKELNHETLNGSFLLVLDGDNWSEGYQLKNSDGSDIFAMGISGDGNRIFFRDGQYKENSGYQFYTANLDREKLINIEPMKFSISGADHIQVSEDGNTFVLSKARQPLVPSDSGAFNTFDLFSYVRDASGQWVQSKINGNNEIVSMGYFVMSKNGNRVFWMPETDPSTIDWMKYNTNQ